MGADQIASSFLDLVTEGRPLGKILLASCWEVNRALLLLILSPFLSLLYLTGCDKVLCDLAAFIPWK